MDSIALNATKRTVTGKQVGQLRQQGKLPAVLYGPGLEPAAIQLDAREATRAIRHLVGTQLIDLNVEGQTKKVLLRELQRDAMKGHYLHVDFYAVDMNREIRVKIPINLVGNSYAVTSLSGVLVHGLTEIEIECLPGDLIPSVDSDLGELKEIGMAIHVKDLYLPKTIKVLTEPTELVARVTYQAKEEDLSTPVTATTAEVEVIEKGKIEEEGEEGEEAGAAKGAPAAKPAAGAKK
jgi:large subunit ribosomal protein L25